MIGLYQTTIKETKMRLFHTVRGVAFSALTVFLASVGALRAEPGTGASLNVPEAKQTDLGLYVTAAEAFRQWKADPEGVKIIDVRTPEEYIFVGHPAMAWNVPLKFIEHKWDAATKKPVMTTNTDFVAQIKKIAQPGDTLLVTCRSGQRSAPAVNLLAKAGFAKVYSVVDGFEGDKVKDPENIFQGQRMKNGWRNAGLPWTYDLDPDLMYREDRE
jgi:rhodanese-related sulfurtransferase